MENRDPQEHFRTSVAACLADAQRRLHTQIQKLSAELIEQLADEVVNLHAAAVQGFRSAVPSCGDPSQQPKPPQTPPPEMPATKHDTYLSTNEDEPVLGEVSDSDLDEAVSVNSPKMISESSCISQFSGETKDASLKGAPEGAVSSEAPDYELDEEAGGSTFVKVAKSSRSIMIVGEAQDGPPEQLAPLTLDSKRPSPSVSPAKKTSFALDSVPEDAQIVQCSSSLRNAGDDAADCQRRRSTSKESAMSSFTKFESHAGPAISVVLLPAWMELKPRRSRALSRKYTTTRSSLDSITSSPALVADSTSDFGRLPGKCDQIILRPGHPVCIVWDMLTLFAMLHDVILIPLAAFDLPNLTVLDVLGVVTTIVWATDLVLSFFRGVADTDAGIIEMRPSRIAKIYLKSWFCLDFSVVVVDVLLLFMAESSWVGVILLARMLRILRLTRLFKILKISERLTVFEGRFAEVMASSEKRAAGFSILKLLLILVVINHFVCCGWYGIGSLAEGKEHWISRHGLNDAGLSYQYSTAFHWAVTQFTPASMEVTPTNYIERAYNVFVIFGGLLMFSTVISSMTQAQLHIRQISAAEKQQRLQVQRYMASNLVSIALSGKIFVFLKRHRKGNKKRLHEREVEAFNALPESMLMSLRVEVYYPTLSWHGLFVYLNQADSHTMSMICHNACLEIAVLHGEDVFLPSTRCTSTYFVTDGKLAYYLGYEAFYEDLVRRGQWVSELGLWADWEHCGRLSGESRCSYLLQVSSSEFLRFACYSGVARKLQHYARAFVKAAVEDCGAELLSDLWGNTRIVRKLIAQISTRGMTSPTNSCKVLFSMWLQSDLRKLAFFAWKKEVDRSKRQVRKKGLWRTCLGRCTQSLPCLRSLTQGRTMMEAFSRQTSPSPPNSPTEAW